MPFDNSFQEVTATIAWINDLVKHECRIGTANTNTQLLRKINGIVSKCADELEEVVKDYDKSTVEAIDFLQHELGHEEDSEVPTDRLRGIKSDLQEISERITFPPRPKGYKV